MKKLSITLIIVTACLFASAQSITHTYHFGKPTVEQVADYQTLSFDNSVSNGTIGEPLLPWQSISLMLPQNTEATAIHVALSDFTELEGQYNLMPAQKTRPISDDSPIIFEKNEDATVYYPVFCESIASVRKYSMACRLPSAASRP